MHFKCLFCSIVISSGGVTVAAKQEMLCLNILIAIRQAPIINPSNGAENQNSYVLPQNRRYSTEVTCLRVSTEFMVDMMTQDK